MSLDTVISDFYYFRLTLISTNQLITKARKR